ncbi:MAG: WG repeat-containing protein [candidate division WOR-3 bacterium]|uniref:WG repeat-containing protein n=1 Tax=candidate division WOR-3 bacterium TaxID=2052148 RepID=A0A7V4FE18_UNCW3
MKRNNLKILILFFILILSFSFGQKEVTGSGKGELSPFEDSKTGKWGYINKQGKIVIRPQFNEAKDFSEGLAAVKIGDKYFYINNEGQIVYGYE